MGRKYKILSFFFGFIAFSFFLRILFLQTFERGHLLALSLEQRTKPIPIKSQRGDILDVNKKVLATSVPMFNIYVDIRYIEDKNKAASVIADFFKLNKADILSKLEKLDTKNFYKVLVENVDKSTLDEFKKVAPTGVLSYETNTRFYPNNEILGKALGFVGNDDSGLYGLELGLDKYLKGIDGEDDSEKDKYYNSIEIDDRNVKYPVDGNDVTLTLDYNIQYQLEKFLKKGVEDAGSKRGAAIVMNPNDGSIYAIADYPSYNPNNFKSYSGDDYFIPSISMSYEPGSTFKPITVSIAENLNLIKDGEKFLDNDNFKVDGYVIHAWNRKGFGYQTVQQVLMNSSNAGAAQIGLKIPVNTFRDYLRKFGFGTKTGIEIAGEGGSLIQGPEEFQKPLVRANVSMGQGIAITPIQLIKAEASVVNGGHSVMPHIVKEIRDKSGNLIYEFKSSSETIISEETSKKVREMLQAVVEEGTGKTVKINGYKVGGKTGTAQKAAGGGGGYIPGKYIVSFLGVAPIDNPKLICLTVLDEPEDRGSSTGGGLMAGPVVRSIFEYALPYLGVRPDSDEVRIEKTVGIPDFTYKTRLFVERNKPSVPYEFRGSGSIVIKQSYVSQNGQVRVIFDTDNALKDKYILMPDLTGLSFNDVLSVLKIPKDSIIINGDASKSVRIQSTPPGETVESSKKLVLWMY